MSDVAAPQQFAEQTREIVRRLAGLQMQPDQSLVCGRRIGGASFGRCSPFSPSIACWIGAFRMDHSYCVVMLVIMAAVFIFAVYRWLIAPLLAVAGDDALCLQVEQKHPELAIRN